MLTFSKCIDILNQQADKMFFLNTLLNIRKIRKVIDIFIVKLYY